MTNAYDPIDPRTGKRPTSEAGRRRAQAEARRLAIAALGWEPEPIPCPPGERYVYTRGELESIAAERQRATVTE